MISEEEEGSMVEKPREWFGRARPMGGGLGGPAVAVKPRAPRWLSPAQLISLKEKKYVNPDTEQFLK